jgi:hypothetical protein
MNYIAPSSPQDKSFSDNSGERDLVLSGLRVAANKARTKHHVIESIYLALRQKQIDCAGAIRRVKDEGLGDLLPDHVRDWRRS